MNRSGIKRGMAVVAISALAVTGIPALAMADTIDTQVTPAVGANDVQLYNDDFGPGGQDIDLTAKNDGTDTTVRIEAGAGLNVPGVIFQVSRNGGAFSDIATVTSRNDDGAFSVEWNPATNGAFAGDDIDLRVVNTADITQTDSEFGFVLRNASAANTQAINIAAGSQKGYFQDPDDLSEHSVGVTGTTSVTSTAAADDPAVSWQGGDATDRDISFDSSNSGDGTFEGVLQIDTDGAPGYNFDDPTLPPAEADQVVVRAATDTTLAPDDQTDDFEAFTLYKQTLTSLTATIAPAVEPDPAEVTITALDQNSQPIAGIDVYERQLGGGFLFVAETDGRGQVTEPQSDNVQYYYANADAPDAFSPAAGDKRSQDVNNQAANVRIVTSPSEGALPVGTAVTETITVTDHVGDPISNRSVRIKRNGPGSNAETVIQTTDANGQTTYQFTCSPAGVTTIDIGIQGPVPPLADPYTWATARDTVTCGKPAPVKKAINPKLKGKNVQGGKDWLKVKAGKANGAKVKIFKMTNSGRKLVAQGRLNANGAFKKVVKDRNGKKVTVYKAFVKPTSDTKAGQTKRLRLR